MHENHTLHALTGPGEFLPRSGKSPRLIQEFQRRPGGGEEVLHKGANRQRVQARGARYDFGLSFAIIYRVRALTSSAIVHKDYVKIFRPKAG